jgi:SAM-dependent methyltransferase
VLLPQGVQGWLTEAQARRLADAAASAPEGAQIVEIGSFHGRSTIVLARAMRPGGRVVAIDPHLGSDRGPQEYAEDRTLGEGDTQTFQANLASHGVADRVRHVRERSEDAFLAVPDPIDVLYVDGAHRYGPALADIRDWGARVRPGGRMLVHDSFSSVGVTLALLRGVTFSGAWRYRGRDGSLAEYERTTGGRSAGAVARQLAQLPWFARNLVIKALILARLTPLTRVLGHDGGHWPY